MARAGFKVFDSDMHVMEPADLWQRYIEPEFKEFAPIGLTSVNLRELRMVHPDGRPWGHNPYRDKNRPPDAGQNFARTQSVYRHYADHGWSAKTQLEAMDVEGIDVAVLYPTRGLTALAEPNMEPRLAAAIARAYNNWLYDFCSENPQRLFGAAMISPFAINEAVKEARRCSKELGFKAVFIRANLFNGKNWFDEYYDSLWSTLEELDLPLGFHEATRTGVSNPGERFEPNFMLRTGVLPTPGTDDGARKFLRGGCFGPPREAQSGVPGRQLQLAALGSVAARRSGRARRRRLGQGFDHGTQRVFQKTMYRIRRAGRTYRPFGHRSNGMRSYRHFDRLSACRLQVSRCHRNILKAAMGRR